MSKARMFFTESFPIHGRIATRDQAPQRRDPEIERKLARVVSLLEKLVAEDRPAVDVMAAKKAKRRENARRLRGSEKFESSEDRVTVPAKYFEDAIRQAVFEAACEGAQAAYAARNPHKAQQQDAPQENRVQYQHKPRQRERWEKRLETTDSASRFLIACEQSQSAYAARNPHKRGK